MHLVEERAETLRVGRGRSARGARAVAGHVARAPEAPPRRHHPHRARAHRAHAELMDGAGEDVLQVGERVGNLDQVVLRDRFLQLVELFLRCALGPVGARDPTQRGPRQAKTAGRANPGEPRYMWPCGRRREPRRAEHACSRLTRSAHRFASGMVGCSRMGALKRRWKAAVESSAAGSVNFPVVMTEARALATRIARSGRDAVGGVRAKWSIHGRHNSEVAK